jgi:hypothetical protein
LFIFTDTDRRRGEISGFSKIISGCSERTLVRGTEDTKAMLRATASILADEKPIGKGSESGFRSWGFAVVPQGSGLCVG